MFSGNVNSSWEEWRARFLQVMNHCMHPSVLSKIRKESSLALKTSHPSNKEEKRLVPYSFIPEIYTGQRGTKLLTTSLNKKKFFRGLGQLSVKEFWKAIKLLNRQEASVPPLIDNHSKM